MKQLEEKIHELNEKVKQLEKEAILYHDFILQYGLKQAYQNYLRNGYVKEETYFFPVLLNSAQKQNILHEVPHTGIGDTVVAVKMRLTEKNGDVKKVFVTYKMLEKLGITTEELFRKAKESTRKKEIVIVDQNLKEIEKRKAVATEGPFYLYYQRGENGGAMIIDTERMKEVSEKIGGDFWAVPLTANVIEVVPADNNPMTVKHLEKEIAGIQKGMPEHKIYSRNIFHYSKRYDFLCQWKEKIKKPVSEKKPGI